MRESWTLRNGKPEACQEGEIVLYTAPTPEEKETLLQVHGIDAHLLESCLDDDELPRLEQDEDLLALILKRPRPHKAHDGFLFKVASMGIFSIPGGVVVVCNEPVEIFSVRRMQGCRELRTYLLLLVYQTTIHFLEHMKVIRMIAESIEGRLNHAVENRGLMDLYTLEKGLVYYLNAVSGNQAVLERIRLLAPKLGLGEDDMELLEDISIENSQCYKLAEIQSSILDNMIETHASISGNNLNVLMKRLTVLSVVFMPLNLLAGIGGMSEWSTFTKALPPAISYSLAMAIMIVVGFITYKILGWTGLGEGSSQRNHHKR
jgi:magnesium transporter